VEGRTVLRAIEAVGTTGRSKKNQVVVCIGRRAIVILPDKDVDLGVVGDDEVIVTRERNLPIGLELAPMKIKRDDPRVAKLVPFTGVSVRWA
jgi:hypothetical protein